MRLLSFLNLVETRLVTLLPEAADGWSRRVNYGSGTACLSSPARGLALTLRACALPDGQDNLTASWHGADGRPVAGRVFFSGAKGFRWEVAYNPGTGARGRSRGRTENRLSRARAIPATKNFGGRYPHNRRPAPARTRFGFRVRALVRIKTGKAM